MNKKIALLFVSTLLLASCSQVSVSLLPTNSYNKIEGNENFNSEGNLIVSDFPIDGIINELDYADSSLTAHMGGDESFETEVTAQLVFGENGLTIGFYSKDKYLSSSTDYTDPQFVVNSDNVEFYIDTLNNKGKKAQTDDYAFLINPEEFIEMRNGTGSYWSSYSGVVDYAVKVEGTINDDSDIDVGWGCEIYLPYNIFGFTKESVIGVAFGCRDKMSFETTSKWTGWGPDPQNINTYVSMDKNGPITSKVEDLTINSGGFEYKDNEYIASTDNALGTLKDMAMSEGTFSTDMYLSYVGDIYDNGITIQVNSNNDLFWEGMGVSYYFFAITHEGNALLGQSKNGEWREICFKESVSYNLNDWNNLKVVIANSYITCYLNNEFMFAGAVASLTSLPFGLRAGMKDIKYKNITYSSSTEGGYVGIEGYHPVWGDFEYTDSSKTQIKSSTIEEAGAIIVNNTALADSDSIEVTMKATNQSDNGLIFKLDDKDKSRFWEDDVSYYFFFVSFDGNAYLGRVLNNHWNNISSKPISGYSIDNSYKLTVNYEPVAGGKIHVTCSINDEVKMNLTFTDELSGTKWGYRAGSIDTSFTL